MKRYLVAVAALTCTTAYGLDPAKCYKTTHGNGLVKYEFPGYSSAEYLTKKHGTFGGTSKFYSQSTTSSVDPFVSTGYTSSTSEFTSSAGGCSYFSQNRQLREEYIARNFETVKEQIAMGQGEHLKSIYFYSLCADSAYGHFKATLQANFSQLQTQPDSAALDEAIDGIIADDAQLAQVCPTA